MITYIDTKNREKYQVLFEKAETVLKDAIRNGTLSSDIVTDIDDLEVMTLNQYFAYLQDLISLSSEEDISYFLRLPLDEELFEINANTRAIKIPSNFSANGVGVQGDETAEIIYFSIDRYFDHMDLANEDMQIVIQWETKDKNRNTIKGISPNFGKDLGTIPGKIIFGWPIYSELTESATPITFAVRFFSLGEEDSNGVRALNYSLATLPATISVGATIDYDLINKTVVEVDRGKTITSRIKNVGIYDPSIPTPQLPTISTPLFIDGKDASVRVADIPDEGDITLKISAHPTDFGAIQYDWRKFSYDSTTGEYANVSDPIANADINNGVYEEVVTDLGDDLYYRITSADGVEPITYSPIVVSTFLQDTTYTEGQGFLAADGSYIKLYKRYSTASVNSVGIYTVNVGARNGVNTLAITMDTADGITIPGPLKPTIYDPEETDTLSITEDDHVIHVIVDDHGIVNLSTFAEKSETDEAAVVKLSYDWKKLVNNIETDISGESVEESDIKVYVLGQNGHGSIPADSNEAACTRNQAQVTVVQSGTNVIVYRTGEEALTTYTSTNEMQGEGKWIGFDIDTGAATIIDMPWGSSDYKLTSADVAEAESVDLAPGHIVFWAKAESLAAAGGQTIKVDGIELTFTYVDSLPTAVDYTFNEDKSAVTITGLTTPGLDEKYVAKVTAERNKVKTSAKSGIYRITHAPEKPIIKYNNQVADYTTQSTAIDRQMKKNGVYQGLSFSIIPIAHSDKLSYIWMRLNFDESIETDWNGESKKLQIDLDNFLSDLFEDQPGDPDIPVDGVFGLTALTNLGEVVEGEDNGPKLQFNDDTPAGIYYCIVVNELNDHRIANVTPFFNVSRN